MTQPLVGSTVLSRVTVTDPDGELAAATVDLVIRAPDGTETSETPDNPSVGVYEYYLPLTEEGWWYAIWTVTVGNYTTVTECGVCAAPTILVGSSP